MVVWYGFEMGVSNEDANDVLEPEFDAVPMEPIFDVMVNGLNSPLFVSTVLVLEL